jgi:hypothetical protein
MTKIITDIITMITIISAIWLVKMLLVFINRRKGSTPKPEEEPTPAASEDPTPAARSRSKKQKRRPSTEKKVNNLGFYPNRILKEDSVQQAHITAAGAG